MKRVSFLVLAGIVVGCASPPPAAAVVAIPAPPPPAAPSAAATAEEAEAPPEDGPDPACSDQSFAAALEALERATRAGDPAKIRAALDAAVELRAADPALRIRSMEAHLAAGDVGAATSEAEVVAALAGGQSATAWLLLGRAARAEGKQELGRALLARSAHLDPGGEAARLLGSASRCTAVAYAPAKDHALSVVTGWKAVWAEVEPRRMAHEELPDPKNDAQARARVCVDGTMREIIAKDTCKGPGPWDVQTGHMHFHDHREVVIPLPARRFALLSYFTGDGCRGGSNVTVSVHGSVIMASWEHHDRLEASAGRCDDGMHDMLMPPCIHKEISSTSFHDATTGKALLYLEDSAATETLKLTGSKLLRTGPAGCNETIDLRRLPAHVLPRPKE